MFQNSIPALVTPFSGGAVDEDAFQRLAERQIAAGSAALVPVGTTGETATLSVEEHKRVVSLCIEAAAGRVPVIAGAGSNSTAEATALVRHAKTEGADAALVVCPYYNKPDQRGLEAHFTAIADAVELPLVLYNVPGRTVSDLLPDTAARLARHPNIVGLKDATGELGRIALTAELTQGQQFVQLSGDDPSSVGARAMGAAGCISVTANVAPGACAAVHAACARGDFAAARELDGKLARLHGALFASPSPGPAKWVLSEMGLCGDAVRLPLLGPDGGARAKLGEAMAAAGLVTDADADADTGTGTGTGAMAGAAR